jgi:hypothetical protein
MTFHWSADYQQSRRWVDAGVFAQAAQDLREMIRMLHDRGASAKINSMLRTFAGIQLITQRVDDGLTNPLLGNPNPRIYNETFEEK